MNINEMPTLRFSEAQFVDRSKTISVLRKMQQVCNQFVVSSVIAF